MAPPENITSANSPGEADQTRLRLLDTAVALFAESGYNGVSVRQICDRAEVKNIGAINYHFQSKEGLYKAAVHHALSHCTRGIHLMRWPAEMPPVDKLRSFILNMMVRLVDNPNPSGMALVMKEFSKPTPAMAEAVRANIKPMADILHGILSELLPKIPFERRVRIGFSIIGQCLYYHQNRPVAEVLFGKDMAKMNTEKIAAHIAEFSLAALGFVPPLTSESGGKR